MESRTESKEFRRLRECLAGLFMEASAREAEADPFRLETYGEDVARVSRVPVRENGEPRLLGVARYYLHPESGAAEFAVVVNDAYQRQGLGRHLMQRLIDIARERGVRRLVGQVLIENAPMLHLMRSLGFSPPILVEDQVVRIELSLTEALCEGAPA